VIVLLLVPLLAPACVEEGGALDFTVAGVPGVAGQLDAVSVLWDGDVSWTTSVTCTLLGGLVDPTYAVAAFDRSVGEGLDAALRIESYDGPDAYVRDEFQPGEALALTWTSTELVEWRFTTSDGGRCGFEVNERGLSGTFGCTDVSVWQDGALAADLAAIQGEWRCGELEWGGAGGGMRSVDTDPAEGGWRG
jgi:hypothetical protein